MTSNAQQHARQLSLPPPYQSYTAYESESISPTSTSPPSQPYLDNPQDINTQQLPYYNPLPAFDSPRNYSRRLRTLIESRRKPTYLALRIPPRRQDLHIVLIDEKSAHSAHDQSHLLPSLPCDVEAEGLHSRTSQHNNNSRLERFRRRRSSCGQEGEISWCSFSILAVVLFMLVCVCSVFVAWSTGLFHSDSGLIRQMRVVGHTSTHHVTVWGSDRVETTKTEGYVLEGEGQFDDLTRPAAYQQADQKMADVKVEAKESAREKIQRRSKRGERRGRR